MIGAYRIIIIVGHNGYVDYLCGANSQMYSGARARMQWYCWLKFMHSTSLVVEPAGAPHVFPGSGDWRPPHDSHIAAVAKSDGAPATYAIVHLRLHFDQVFHTGSKTDLPPTAAGLRSILESPASTTVLIREGFRARS